MELLENYTLFSELEDWSVRATLYGDEDCTEEKAPAELLLPGGGPDGPALEWESLVRDLLAPEAQVVDHNSAKADTLAPLAQMPISLSGDQDYVVNELHALFAPSASLDVESLLQPEGLPIDDIDYGIEYGLRDSVSEIGPIGSDDSCGSPSGVSSPSGTGSSVTCDSDCDVSSAAAAAGKAKAAKSSRARARPYDALPKEKKDKKKLQNKNAATRYRQKKKAEDLILQADVHVQMERNKLLKEKVASLEQEIAQCKEIMMFIFGKSAM